jgi:hypothetical protein
MAFDIAGWVTLSCCAALAMLPNCATVVKT